MLNIMLKPIHHAMATSILLLCYVLLFLLIDMVIPQFKEWTKTLFLFVVLATVGKDVLQAFALVEEIATVFSNVFLSIYPLLASSLLLSGSIVNMLSLHPIILFFVQAMVYVSDKWLIPAVSLAVILDFASVIVPTISFARLADFIRFTVLSIVSACVICYSILMTISGVTMLSVSQAISAPLKKVVEQSVPFVGAFVVEGFSLFNQFQAMTTGWLGGTALVTVWTLAFVPSVQLILAAFTFKYLGAVLEPIAYSEISKLLDDVSKSIFVLCGVSFLVAFAFVFTCLFLIVFVKIALGGGT